MLTFSKVLPLTSMEVYNLTSLYEGFYRLQFIPPFEIFDNCSNDFDIAYMNWIFNYEPAYMDFMSIISKIIQGINVCILVIDNDNFDIINESLQKLLSQRYGIVANIVNTIEDWDECTDIGPRNVGHTFNLDRDLEIYSTLIMNKNPEVNNLKG